MSFTLAALTVFSLAPAFELPTTAWQLVPAVDGELAIPKATKSKAVLCIPGLYPHPLRPEKATKPEKHPWFEPKAPLLKALADEFDVYGFGYAQTIAVDGVAFSTGLRETVAKLKAAKYQEIVLIGHSAGGLIAHQFAELYPDSGVTKVLPVAAPYTGSELADLKLPLPYTQVSYIKSLAPTPRLEALKERLVFPKSIDICCIMCKVTKLPHDIMVTLDSQWPSEIRQQGIPATLVNANHFEILKSPQGVSTVADLAKSKLVRWGDADIKQAQAIIFSKQADEAAVPPPTRRPLLKRIGDLIPKP